MKNYCIRPDYLARTEAATCVETAGAYWNDERRALTSIYQYYVYLEAATILKSRPQSSFVDVGCGYPKKVRDIILPVVREATMIDQPSMEPVVTRDFPDLRFIPMNLEQCKDPPPGEFDCVLCADVVEHLLDPDPLMAFLRRLAKPDGVIIISTPERDAERGRNCLRSPHPEHVREWTAQEFARYLLQHSLEILEHRLLPRNRLWTVEELVLPLLQRIRIRRYANCQMAVCRLVAR
jgi:SAM-dependent methyltransferase